MRAYRRLSAGLAPRRAYLSGLGVYARGEVAGQWPYFDDLRQSRVRDAEEKGGMSGLYPGSVRRDGGRFRLTGLGGGQAFALARALRRRLLLRSISFARRFRSSSVTGLRSGIAPSSR